MTPHDSRGLRPRAVVPSPAAAPPPDTPPVGDPHGDAATAGGRPAPVAAPLRRGRWRWVRPALLVLAVVVAVQALSWWRTAREELAAFDAWLDDRTEDYRATPALRPEELADLRRSLNSRHLELAQRFGVGPPATQADMDSLIARYGLVEAVSDSTRLVGDGTYSRPYLTPSTAAMLDSVAVAFRRTTAEAQLPAFVFIVTSTWRSTEDQRALTRVNVNAARNRSSHEYATTFDVTYRRFGYAGPGALPVPAPSDRTPGFVRSALAAVFQQRLAARFDQLAHEAPGPLAALFGRALIGLEDRGVLVALRETRQPVYHVTVARRVPRPQP